MRFSSFPSFSRVAAALLLAVPLALLAAAPAFATFPVGLRGVGDQEVIDSVRGSSGAVYVVGTFDGNIGIGSQLNGAQGLTDVFVAKINSFGDLVWLETAGGTNVDRGLAIGLDPAENVYVAGIYFDDMELGKAPLRTTLPESGNNNGDIFVAKYAGTDGAFQWAARASGAGNDLIEGLAFIPGNPAAFPPIPERMVVGGSFQCELRFYDQGGSESTRATAVGSAAGCGNNLAGRRRPISAAIATNGTWQWRSVAFDSIDTSPSQPVGAAIEGFASDSGSNIYAYGPIRRMGTFDLAGGGTTVLQPGTPPPPPTLGSLSTGALPTGSPFAVTNDRASSPSWSAHSSHPGNGQISLIYLDFPAIGVNSGDGIQVEFQHAYSFSQPLPPFCINGAEFQFSGDNGANWVPLFGAFFQEGAPNGFSPATGLQSGFCGNSPNWPLFNRVRLAFNPNFSGTLRLRWISGSQGEAETGWWIDDIKVTRNGSVVGNYTFPDGNWTDSTQSGHFVGKVSSAGSGWDWVQRLPDGVTPQDIALDRDGRILLAGDKDAAGSASFPLEGGGSEVLPATAGAFVAELRDTGAGGAWQWARSTVGGSARGVYSGADGITYLTGPFTGSFRRDPGAPALDSGGAEDVFVARLDTAGTFYPGDGASLWGDGRSAVRAGGTSADVANTITGNGNGQVYLGGRFAGLAVFGAASNGVLSALNGNDAFVANLDSSGKFAELSSGDLIVGDAVLPPPGAELTQAAFVPDFYVGGVRFSALDSYFKWSPPAANGGTAKLIPVKAFASQIEIRWRVAGQPLESPQRIITFGTPTWPTRRCNPAGGITTACYQLHLASAPVEILPGAGGPARSFLELHRGDGSDAEVVSGSTFKATASAYSTLVYVAAALPDLTSNPLDVRVVRTLRATEPLGDGGPPHLERGAACTIGSEIVPAAGYHDQPSRAGYVLNEKAFYDGVGAASPYNRAARTGRIVPVNRVNPNRPQDADKAMLVAWYQLNDLQVAWPQKAVDYDCRWPASPLAIIIASQQGTESLGQPSFDPLAYPQLQIYQQADPRLPGYNPNDEHALIAPSNTGSGRQAIFALRADFGGTLDPTGASDPYVVAKYFDGAAQAFRHLIYRVDSIGGGFGAFSFPGFAGRTVEPPYPVRLQSPCPETRVVGEVASAPPPIPFYRDKNSQLWARAEGTGQVRYWYPLQPGFFYDLDNDDVMDDVSGDGTFGNEAGACIPWMARLPVALGGTADPQAPIEVGYQIAWPADVPLLTVGETLLKAKRGLPEIYNQAATKVVFDQLQEASPLDPARNLAQLIDPTGSRSVPLAALPSGGQALAVSLDEQGRTVITGNAAGDRRLPYSIYSRLRWDPLTQKLIFSGVFDDTQAGEPLLLLNVMTVSERDRLLAISTSTAWQNAVQSLFAKSRNPHEVQKICTASTIVAGKRVCTAVRPVDPATDMLIGSVDRDGDGLLEPYLAQGVKAGLSAGAAQGTGYLTLAFNDSPSLALPVSLEVIKVDCLTYPAPPAPPTLVSPYIGQVNVIGAVNVFDEQVTLRHSGDFGGRVEGLEFEWFLHPDIDGTPPAPPDLAGGSLGGWQQLPVAPLGAVEITLGGANVQTLADNWFFARYKGLPACNNGSDFTVPAGQPGSTPTDLRAQLSLGWVKRVVAGLNPFDARVAEFHRAATNTFASMIAQLGKRYEGPIAFSDDPENLNGIGLIEAYETVFRRAQQLSIDSNPPVNYEPANAALLNIGSRLVDFYLLLGNEAYADAQDPTIGITTTSAQLNFASLAPTIFNFQNQTASLLEEELVLLRGRDNRQGPTAASPVYNRFFWNFTQGDGEVAYALSYGIKDGNGDGFVDERDARIQYPQGHGDAWGHYLTAIKTYYRLLRHPYYSWNPRPEAVPVAGVPLQVDYFDERKFAKAAAARAHAGAEIVDLTYRSEYVEDPAGQWQGYADTQPQRAWGLADWGRRVGQGAYLDWAIGNSLLPAADPNPAHVGIQRIERRTTSELGEIGSAYAAVQSQVDEADRGLNPLGVAKGVVPFDIDPALVDSGKTHFEQVYDRALAALENAVEVWDFANQSSRMLRFNQDQVAQLTTNSEDRERDFRNRLIEVFGRPYEDDVGPGGTYPSGYAGPDLYHYGYVDAPALTGTPFELDEVGDPEQANQIGRVKTFEASFKPLPGGVGFLDFTSENQQIYCGANPLAEGCSLGDPPATDLEVEYFTWNLPVVSAFALTKPPSWQGVRPAAGRVQEALDEILNAQIAARQALSSYEQLRGDIQAEVDGISATFNLRGESLRIKNAERLELAQLTTSVQAMNTTAITLKRISAGLSTTFKASAECVPKSMIAGVAAGGDLFSAVRCAMEQVSSGVSFGLDTAADGVEIAQSIIDSAKEDVSLQAAIETDILGYREEMDGTIGKIEAMLRQEPVLRNEIYSRAQIVEQARQNYRDALAEGLRTLEELVAFRKQTAAAVQDYRHQDMAFRIFRNDALQKYRASFDLAARFAYLTATAYDYDTNLVGSRGESGRRFLTDIVRQRSLGQLLGGAPVAGSPGLTDSLGRMKANFAVLKTQMGFNNPQIETNRFSLREGLFRLSGADAADADWRAELLRYRVDDLWQVPEFRRYARPFTEESLGRQPGLVIPFSTTVTFGLNFFGWPLAAGDSAYDPSQFATRVRSVGVWFDGYGNLPLSLTPRVYLVPVGADVLRPPTAGDFETREWAVVDQLIPVPYDLGGSDLEREDWRPLDSLSGGFTEIRRFGSFRAHDYDPGAPFGDQTTSDNRLVGRSVWNTRWLLIIPGGTLLFDPRQGIDTFIGSGGDPGVEDILIFFKTYAYQGF